MQGAVGFLISFYKLQIFQEIFQWKSFFNRLRFDRIMIMSLWPTFWHILYNNRLSLFSKPSDFGEKKKLRSGEPILHLTTQRDDIFRRDRQMNNQLSSFCRFLHHKLFKSVHFWLLKLFKKQQANYFYAKRNFPDSQHRIWVTKRHVSVTEVTVVSNASQLSQMDPRDASISCWSAGCTGGRAVR